MHHFDVKRAIQLLQDEQITTVFAVPTMWKWMLQEDVSADQLPCLRSGMYGGEPMPKALVHACHDRLGIKLTQAYGMTEMGPTVAFLMNDDQLTKAGSAGRACLNHEIRIVRPRTDEPSDPDDILEACQVGEILVKGPSVMAGYYRNQKATEHALYKGWYHSGDLGYFDEDGYLWIADRADHMIVSGGENVYPREVEEALYEHPDIQEVAVLGEPDERWGQTVVAFVVKKNELLTASDLDAYCKNSSKLANYKRPRRYVFVEELPRNTSGKLQKFRLKEAMKKGL
jgi:fatty-acyl-CoA synthase